jgi:hypothetical protein
MEVKDFPDIKGEIVKEKWLDYSLFGKKKHSTFSTSHRLQRSLIFYHETFLTNNLILLIITFQSSAATHKS